MNVHTCPRCGEPIRPEQETWNPSGLEGPVHKRCPEPSKRGGVDAGGPGPDREAPPRPADGGGGGGIILPGEG